MKKFLVFFGVIVFMLLTVLLYLAVSYLFPYPYSKMNILFIVLLLVLVWRQSGYVVWMSFFLHFLIELYTLTPFGVVLFSSTISILGAYWLSENVLTNRSWLSTVFLGIMTMTTYRILYLVALLTARLFSSSVDIVWSGLATTFAWELLFTVLGFGVAYACCVPIFRRFPGRQHFPTEV